MVRKEFWSPHERLFVADLKIANLRLELLPLEEIWQCDIEAALRNANLLRTNANPSLIQDFDRILVPLSYFSEHLRRGNLHIREGERASAGCS